MKSYANVEEPTTNKVVFPVMQYYPQRPVEGEVIIIKNHLEQGVRYYDAQMNKWIPLFSVINNIWETLEVPYDEHQVYTLQQNTYTTDGNSLNVYVDGVRLPKNRVAEISSNTFAIKETYNELDEPIFLKKGQIIECQIFNKPVW
jgi:hypothetical protein